MAPPSVSLTSMLSVPFACFVFRWFSYWSSQTRYTCTSSTPTLHAKYLPHFHTSFSARSPPSPPVRWLTHLLPRLLRPAHTHRSASRRRNTSFLISNTLTFPSDLPHLSFHSSSCQRPCFVSSGHGSIFEWVKHPRSLCMKSCWLIG